VGDSSWPELLCVVAIGIALALLRRPLARFLFATLASMNDPRTGGRRWSREHAALRTGLEWFLALAGAAFVVEAILDWLGVISLAG
jgi:hypothetical protein